MISNVCFVGAMNSALRRFEFFSHVEDTPQNLPHDAPLVHKNLGSWPSLPKHDSVAYLDSFPLRSSRPPVYHVSS